MMQFEDDDNCPEMEAVITDKSQPFVVKTEADVNDVTEHPRDDKPRPYLCTVCDKQFTQRGNLNVHKRIHTGEKPFVCRMCNKGFTQITHLNVHMIRHTDAEGSSYSCSQCEKRFHSQSILRRHTNVHSSKYKCTECGKCFQRNHHLMRHKLSDSGERPFEFSVCGKRFT